MDENKFWLSLWLSIIGAVTLIGVCAFLFTYMGQRDLIKAGFSREMLLGYSQPQWVKR